MSKTYLTWEDIENALTDLSLKLSGIKPDFITGIPRNGTLLAIMLSHRLNVKFLPSLPPCSTSLPISPKILLIDDISDTGKTFVTFIKNHPNYSFVTASIHISPHTSFIPDFYHKEIEEGEWVVYPFETNESSKADYKEK